MPNLHNLSTSLLEQVESANWQLATWIILGSYCLGCFATGYYLVRYRTGQDVRNLGSGGVGAKNVGRMLGWQGFLITLSGDFCKGAFAMWAARHFTGEPQLLALSILSVLAGHIWPAQLGFRGGKGMATLIGALAVYDVRLVLGFALLFAGPYAVMRRTVLPGLFAVAMLPVVALFISPDPLTISGAGEALRISCVVSLVLVAHRKNISEEIALLMGRKHLQSKRKI